MCNTAHNTRPVATRAQWKKLVRHLELVIERNKTLNLTRITGWDEAVVLHILDSLLLQEAFSKAPAGAFVDIGTGAGFPGIPLAIVTGRKGTLVDSVAKKAAAVQEFVNELQMSDRLRVESKRIEVLGNEERGRYTVVTARAVAQTATLVEYAAPLLRKGGHLVVAKARPSDAELAAANKAAETCGLRFVERSAYELPKSFGHREVLSFCKVGNPRVRLPRAVGMAQHHPFGVK